MAQYFIGNIDTSSVDGDDLADIIEDFENAVTTGYSGPDAPTAQQAGDGFLWVKTDGNERTLMVRVGTADVPVASLDSDDTRPEFAGNAARNTFIRRGSTDKTIEVEADGSTLMHMSQAGVSIANGTATDAAAAGAALDMSGSDTPIRVPRWATDSEPPGAAGDFGFDVTTRRFRQHDGTSWSDAASGAGRTAEQVRDIVGALIQDGTGTTAVYDDDGGGAGSVRINADVTETDDLPEGTNPSNRWFTDERAQDAAAAMMRVGNGATGVYDDTANTYTIGVDYSNLDVAAGSGLSLTESGGRYQLSATGASSLDEQKINARLSAVVGAGDGLKADPSGNNVSKLSIDYDESGSGKTFKNEVADHIGERVLVDANARGVEIGYTAARQITLTANIAPRHLIGFAANPPTRGQLLSYRQDRAWEWVDPATPSIPSGSIGADELDVSGNGTSGQALLSDGDGTFSWGDAAGSYTLPVAGLSLGGVREESGGDIDVNDTGGMSIKANAVGADELDVSGNGTSGQALLSDGDGTMRWGSVASSYTLPVAGSALGGIKEGGDLDVDGTGLATVKDGAIGADELDVSGNGTAGQFLQSDGDGTMTWATVSAGGTYTLPVAGTALGGVKSDGDLAVDSDGTPTLKDGTVDAAALDVSGNGTSGQVLASDGDGSMSWTDQTAAYTLPVAGSSLGGVISTGSDFDISNAGAIKFNDGTFADKLNTRLAVGGGLGKAESNDVVTVTIDFANATEAENGAENTKPVTSLRVQQGREEAWKSFTLADYSRIASGTPSQGQFRVDGGTLRFRPKSGNDTSRAADIMKAGLNVEVSTSAGIGLSGTVSSYTESSGVYTLTMTSPYDGSGSFTGSAEIKLEGYSAYRAARQAPRPDSVSALDLKAGGNGTAGQMLLSDGDGTMTWTDQPAAYTLPNAGSAIGGIKTGGDLDLAAGVATLKGGSVGADELDVSGNGTSGQVLASDGDGSMSWTDQTAAYTLPTASASVKGGVKIGSGVSVANDGTISVAGYTLPVAGSAIGGVKSDGDLDVDADGTPTIKDGAVDGAAVSGLSNTSSGFVQADGDGTFSIGTPSGGGSVSYASSAETIAGTVTDKAVNPAGLQAKTEREAEIGVTDGWIVRTSGSPSGDYISTWNSTTRTFVLRGTESGFRTAVANSKWFECVIDLNNLVRGRVASTSYTSPNFTVVLESDDLRTVGTVATVNSNAEFWTGNDISQFLLRRSLRIRPKSLNGSSLQDATIGTGKLAANAVTPSKIARTEATGHQVLRSKGTPSSEDANWGAVSTHYLSGLTGSSSGFIQADGDGTMSIGTPSGGGNYTLPVAGASLGGVREESGADIDVNATGGMTIKANAVGPSELNLSGNGTAGQVLSSDGDGTFSWANDARARIFVAQETARNQLPNSQNYNVFPRTNTTDGADPGSSSWIEFTPLSSSSRFLLEVSGKPGWLDFKHQNDLDLRLQRILQNTDNTWPAWSTSSRGGGSNSDTVVETTYVVEWRRARYGNLYWRYVYIPTGNALTRRQRLRIELRRRVAVNSNAASLRTDSIANLASDIQNNGDGSGPDLSFTPFTFTALEFV